MGFCVFSGLKPLENKSDESVTFVVSVVASCFVLTCSVSVDVSLFVA